VAKRKKVSAHWDAFFKRISTRDTHYPREPLILDQIYTVRFGALGGSVGWRAIPEKSTTK